MTHLNFYCCPFSLSKETQVIYRLLKFVPFMWKLITFSNFLVDLHHLFVENKYVQIHSALTEDNKLNNVNQTSHFPLLDNLRSVKYCHAKINPSENAAKLPAWSTRSYFPFVSSFLWLLALPNDMSRHGSRNLRATTFLPPRSVKASWAIECLPEISACPSRLH